MPTTGLVVLANRLGVTTGDAEAADGHAKMIISF